MKREGFAFSFKDLMSKQTAEGGRLGGWYIVIFQKSRKFDTDQIPNCGLLEVR